MSYKTRTESHLPATPWKKYHAIMVLGKQAPLALRGRFFLVKKAPGNKTLHHTALGSKSIVRRDFFSPKSHLHFDFKNWLSPTNPNFKNCLSGKHLSTYATYFTVAALDWSLVDLQSLLQNIKTLEYNTNWYNKQGVRK